MSFSFIDILDFVRDIFRVLSAAVDTASTPKNIITQAGDVCQVIICQLQLYGLGETQDNQINENDRPLRTPTTGARTL